MAYAIKYLFKFESSNGTTREIRVLQDGYTGEVIQRPLGRAPILKKQQNGPVHGTSLEFFAECNVDREFIEFYTSDPKAYRVDLYAGAVLLWQGYITPELYSEPDIAPPYDVQVVATDGVGELKLYDYAAQGAVTLRALLSGLLSRTGLGTDIYLISSLKPGSAGAGSLLEKTINLDYMAGNSCYEVLTYILDTLHATITWWKGAWILTRETNVTFTSGKVRYFNTAGNSALLADSVQVLGKMYANPAWPVGQLSTVIDPAKNRVTVQAPWHVVTCLRNSDMGSDSDWVKAKNARYETDGYVLPININTGTSETAVISQATSMAGLRVPMSLSVKATGATSEISAQVVGAVLGVLLTYKVGNVTYHLVKGDDGVPVWQQGGDIGTYIPLRTRIDFQQQLATWDSSRIEAEELTIDNIPPFLQGTTFPAGTLTVYILGYCAKIYGAYLDVVLPKGYQDILRISNGARGEGSEVEIAIGRETADNAYYAAFLQGLLLDSGNLIISFSDANFSGGMDYLAFIARDYALSVALPRAKVTGTVYLESGIAAPPLVFTKGALNYWLQTWSWNLYEDELEIEGLTLPSASLTVESETILESNGSTVSSAGGAGSSSAGSSMGGGVGTNYWEIDGTLNTLLKPKDAYAYVHSKDGLFFTGAALSGTVVPDLYVDTVNNQRVLRSPLPLITGGDQIVIDGTPGGGGGGGASNLKELEDVYHNASGVRRYSSGNVGNTDLLGYDSTKGWYAVKLGTGLQMTNGELSATGTLSSVSLAAGASNGTLHLVVNGTAQSDVAVTGLKALAYKDSLAFSEITGTASASQIPTLAISKISGLQTALDGKQPLDADLTAIAGLTGTSGFLKKTAANTWSLDTNTYLTTGTAASTYQPLDSDLTAIAAISTGTGLLKRSVSGSTVSWTIDTNTYLTGITSTMVTNALGYTPANVTALADYVKLTSAGQQVISVTGATDTPVVFKSGLENASWIGFRDSANTILGYIGMTSTDGPAVYVGGAKKIWHAGNLTLASLAGNTAKGSTSLPIYYTGSALAPITDLDLLSQSTGNVKANRVYLTSSIYFYTETVGGTVCVRLNAPFITAGDQIVISGTPGGGGGGGATTLAGLDDVAITSVANGQLLQYNGSKWVNVAASSVGGVTSVAGYTGAVTAAQISSAIGLSDYLPKTGGTIKNGLVTGPLTLDTDSAIEIGIRLFTNGVQNGWVGYNTTYGIYLWDASSNKYLGIKDDGTPHYHGNTLLHAGNYTSYVNTTNFPGLMGNQTITLSGDVSGSGATSITTTIGEGKVTNAMLAGSIANSKLSNSSITINGSFTSLGGSFSTASITAGTAGQSGASTGVSFSIPYVTMNKYGIVTAYGTHTHTILASDLTTTIGSTTYAAYHSAGYVKKDGDTMSGNLTIVGMTTSGTITSTVATGTAPLSVTSTTVVSNLNADLLDGQHGSYYATASSVTTLQGYFTNGAAKTARALSSLAADSTVWYDTQYTVLAQWDDNTHLRLKCLNAAGTVSYDVRVSAADKFVTARTLWGQTFDGTANVTGALSSVTNIDSLLYFDTTNSRVGVGVSSPSYAFHCAGDIATDTYLRMNAWSGYGSGSATMWYNATGAYVELSTTLFATSARFGGANGVCIGRTYAGATASAYDLIERGQSGGTLYLQYNHTGGISMCYGGGNVMIGAGTNTANSKLYVNGNAAITGYVYANRTSNAVASFVMNKSGSYWSGIGYDGTTNVTRFGPCDGTGVWTASPSVTDIWKFVGLIQTTGDQVVSSDLTLKENLTPVTYSVSDIAKARAVEFDWKDGRGHSMGSIAQDWLSIAPALVHGKEGNMSLAYGQLALVNTILLARQSESHEERIKELEARVAELEMENERLRMN